MYRNLEAEIARAGVPQKQLATAIHCTPATMSLKLNRKAPITLEQAATIKRTLGVDMPLEELFAWTDDGNAGPAQ